MRPELQRVYTEYFWPPCDKPRLFPAGADSTGFD